MVFDGDDGTLKTSRLCSYGQSIYIKSIVITSGTTYKAYMVGGGCSGN